MFHNSYHDARAAFRNQAQAAGGTMYAWPLPTQQADATEPLTIDAAVFGTGRKALVLSSGLHGMEGFAGSATQLTFIKSHLAQSPSADRRIVLLHVINPFGMANLRRVNGSNVDLNRNFLRDKQQYQGKISAIRGLLPG
jgi:predicted deacylase